MGISYFGIVTNQCEKLLKVLYFAICICCFRIINIDQQYIYQIAQSIIKSVSYTHLDVYKRQVFPLFRYHGQVIHQTDG